MFKCLKERLFWFVLCHQQWFNSHNLSWWVCMMILFKKISFDLPKRKFFKSLGFWLHSLYSRLEQEIELKDSMCCANWPVIICENSKENGINTKHRQHRKIILAEEMGNWLILYQSEEDIYLSLVASSKHFGNEKGWYVRVVVRHKLRCHDVCMEASWYECSTQLINITSNVNTKNECCYNLYRMKKRFQECLILLQHIIQQKEWCRRKCPVVIIKSFWILVTTSSLCTANATILLFLFLNLLENIHG